MLKLGPLYPPLRRSWPNLAWEYTHDLRLHAKFHPDRFIVLPVWGAKPPNLAYFWFQHSVVAPPSSIGKVKRGCTTTVLLPKGIKTISIFKRLNDEVVSTISSVQKHFLPPTNFEPCRTWHDDRGGPYYSWPVKRLRMRRIVFALGGTKIWGKCTPMLNPITGKLFSESPNLKCGSNKQLYMYTNPENFVQIA